MSNTPLPEPLSRLMKFAGKKRNEVSNPCFTARECIAMADQVHAHAAEKDARIKVLEGALRKAIVQNEHDMLMTGEELRAARAALGDKT